MDVVMPWLLPILAGFGLSWFAGKCRGRNARKAFNYAAWGAWLLLLTHMPPLIPLLGPLNWLLWILPSAFCFLMAGSSLLKEMRAQQRGEYTDVA